MDKREIRKRSEKDSISMEGCAWAFKDRVVLLDLVDTQAKQIKDGREIVEELYSLNYTHGVDMRRTDAWLKAVK